VALRPGVSEKELPLTPVPKRTEADLPMVERALVRSDPDPELVALAAQATVAADSRQALPEVRSTALVGHETELADTQSQPQAAATASAPPAAVPPEARAALPAVHALDLPARLGTPAFVEDFGNRVVWMAGNGQHAAEFRIDPPHLGPVEVRLALSNDQASLVLLSPHASVREALQSTLPRLQELLGAAGINLGSVHVGAQGSGQRSQNGDPSGLESQRLRVGGIESHHALAPAAGWSVLGTGVVDTYA
jgi:flagellar hook-length control protein FliK